MKKFKEYVTEGSKNIARAHQALGDSVEDFVETETKPKSVKHLSQYAKEISHDILDHGFGPAKHIDRLAQSYYEKHFK